MKTITLKRMGLCMISAVVLLASGCGARVEVAINEDLSAEEKCQYYLTEQEVSQLLSYFEPDAVEEPFRKVTINGKQYSKVITEKNHYNAVESKGHFSEINKKFVLASSSVLPVFSGDGSYADEVDRVDFAEAAVSCPYQVYYTNGTVRPDGKTVDFDLSKIKEGETLYAVFDKSLYNVDKVEFSGVKNKGIYNNFKKVAIKTKGVLTYVNCTEVKADDKADAKGEFSGGTTTDGYKNWYFGADGVYRLHTQLLNGKKKTVEFTIDTTKPKTNIKKKSYKKGVKITFSDKTSGIKSATLNGKKIKSGTKVKKAGSYKLVLTDKAGNVRRADFNVK